MLKSPAFAGGYSEREFSSAFSIKTKRAVTLIGGGFFIMITKKFNL